MDQKIKIRIAERDYNMSAPTPKDEERIRLAASVINRKISGYNTKFPGRSMVDILAFVALNESISSITLAERLNMATEEAASLHKDIENYIENIEK